MFYYPFSACPLYVETNQNHVKYTNQSPPKSSQSETREANNNLSTVSSGGSSDIQMCSECAEEFDTKAELEEHVKTHKVIIKKEAISPTNQNHSTCNLSTNQMTNSSMTNHMANSSVTNQMTNSSVLSTHGSSQSGSRSLSPKSFSPGPRNYSPALGKTPVSQNPLLNRSNSPYEDFIKMNNLDGTQPRSSMSTSYLSGSLKNKYSDESSGSYFDNYMRARGLDSPNFGQRNTGSPMDQHKSISGIANSADDMNSHSFICPMCNKSYLDKDSLARHVQTHSNFPCPVCGKTYSTKSNLQTHMKKHSDERLFCCNVCDKSFTSASLLKAHMRIHSGEKPFTCPTCGVAFAKNIHLKRHLSIHTGIKPHECHICSKRFSRSDHLKRHIQSIHTQDRPHICSICSKDFVRKYELNKHMKQCHYGVAVIDDDDEMNSSHNDSYYNNDSFGDPPSQIVRSLLPRFPLLNNSEGGGGTPDGQISRDITPEKSDTSTSSPGHAISREVTPTKRETPSPGNIGQREAIQGNHDSPYNNMAVPFSASIGGANNVIDFSKIKVKVEPME